MANRGKDGNLDDNLMYIFLKKTIAFIWTYAVTNPGVNALRTPIFAEMLNIVKKQPVNFKEYNFDYDYVKTAFFNYKFSNIRAITKSLLVWWCYQDTNQRLIPLNTTLEIEHIYAKSRFYKENTLIKPENVESLGNKAILEKRINIRASDYRFIDKIKYYQGYINNRQQKKEGTQNFELLKLSSENIDFTEQNIIDRKNNMIESFLTYISLNGLIK